MGRLFVSVIIMLMLFYKQTPEQTLKHLNTTVNGLSAHQVDERLQKYGLNELKIKGEPLWKKLIEPFANVFMAVLFIAVLISLWHHAYFDAIIIGVIMLTSAVIYYVQRFSTEKILKSLQKKSAQEVMVQRAGKSNKVMASQLVPGDIVSLEEGDKIPADLRIIELSGLRSDEAVLTGESVPISKSLEAISGDKEIYEQANMLFQGAFVVAGTATGVVVATGNKTEFGQIALLANKNPDDGQSPVQKKIDKLIGYIIAVVGAVAVIAFILSIMRGMEFSESLRFVIALSVSAVPESLPVAISVILVLGMRRMAAKKALVRSMAAIETVGVVTTIATDKTGTLTKNILSVQEVWQPEWSRQNLAECIKNSVNQHGQRSYDPLDIAFMKYTPSEAPIKTGQNGQLELVSQLPFDQSFSMSGNLWSDKKEYQLFIKGAPEQVFERSHLTTSELNEAESVLNQLTSQGYRVIALGKAVVSKPFSSFTQAPSKMKIEFAGLVAVADTLRPSARQAIAAAQQAGVSVRMITGDHLETAYAIGKKLGLVTVRSEVFDSRRMNSMNNDELAEAAQNARIFSRVTPENKYRILEVLKLSEITAMTGDGVNDVPALANADVGVSMGSGSQIAKDAGDIVLLTDDFANIVRAIREGRIIFANIRRMLFYLLSTNIGEVMTTIGAMLIGLPMPLVPVQILWINLVTDTTMVIPLGLEPGEKNIMHQKPTPPNGPILSGYMISRIIVVASVMCLLALGLYAYYTAQFGSDYGRTVAFVALVVVQWANAFSARSTYESAFSRLRIWNGAFFVGLVISISLQTIALSGPLHDLLHIHPIAIQDIVLVSLISFVLSLGAVELHKLYGRHRKLHTKSQY